MKMQFILGFAVCGMIVASIVMVDILVKFALIFVIVDYV